MLKKRPKEVDPNINVSVKRQRNKPAGSVIALFAVLVVAVLVIAGFGIDHVSRTNPQFCGLCHNMTDHVDSYLNANHLDNSHYQAGVGCKDCHSDYTVSEEVGSLVAYITGNYDEPMDKIKVKDDMCLECHISMEYLAEQTDMLYRNPHQSHFVQLRCSTCHPSHDRQINYCGSCHENGGQRMVEDGYYPRSENPFAPGNTPNENAPTS